MRWAQATGDMAVAEELADHGPVLALGQSVVVGLSGTELRKLDEEFLQQRGHALIDVFGAIVVGVEAEHLEREGFQQLFQDRKEVQCFSVTRSDSTLHTEVCFAMNAVIGSRCLTECIVLLGYHDSGIARQRHLIFMPERYNTTH